MTKSRQSVTKLRLSRLIRCLIALGCVKLGIMAWGVLDAHWQILPQNQSPAIEQTEERMPIQEASIPSLASQETQEITAPEDIAQAAKPAPEAEELPQGAKAAELAAAARPQGRLPGGFGQFPVPLLPAEPFNPLAMGESYFTDTNLEEPAPLDAPLVEAGVSLPEPVSAPTPQEPSIWDMAELKTLPIPGLGSAQIAHAASLDMPVPATAPKQSPFTPAEQAQPMANQGRVLPDAPAFPQNIPAAGEDGSLLPQRQPSFGQNDSYSPNPPYAQPRQAPAPNIAPKPADLNSNMKAQELARQQQDILMLRQQMDQRLQDLQNAEGKMKSMLDQAKDLEDQKVKNLVQMYANMKPRTAAQALENMDERIAVRILSGMAPKQSGEILTYTNPVKTAKFTEMITRLKMGE